MSEHERASTASPTVRSVRDANGVAKSRTGTKNRGKTKNARDPKTRLKMRFLIGFVFFKTVTCLDEE